MQNYEVLDQNIQRAFAQLKAEHPQRLQKRLNFSWSNWGFGLEPLERSLERLAKNDIHYVELHGNHYGDDLGYDAVKTKKALADYGIACAGVCGMFSADNDLSSNRHIQRQAAIDYIKRELYGYSRDYCPAFGSVSWACQWSVAPTSVFQHHYKTNSFLNSA